MDLITQKISEDMKKVLEMLFSFEELILAMYQGGCLTYGIQ